ncbi:MAG: DUF3467 domain-containing protein [Phycisphaeraceae bacterium]
MADEQPKTNVQMRIDESKTRVTYANAFRHHATPQELILDFGINVVTPTKQPKDGEPGEAQMNFQIDNRLVMNYLTAKRLAGTLVQLVQAHEKRFGEIKLDQQQG